MLALGLAASPAYAHPNLGQGCRCHGGSKKPAATSSAPKTSNKPAAKPAAPAPVVQAPVAPPAPVASPEPAAVVGSVDPVHGGLHFIGDQPGYGGRSDR
jgi:hypothetical protein